MLSKLPPIYWRPLPLPSPLGTCASQQPLQASPSRTPQPCSDPRPIRCRPAAGWQPVAAMNVGTGLKSTLASLLPAADPAWSSCSNFSLCSGQGACADFPGPNHTQTAGVCVSTCILSFVDMYSGNIVCKSIYLLHTGFV